MHTAIRRLPARARAQLTASDVSVMRGTNPVLNHVDLILTPSSRVAIVGENGRGKSTLLHVLAGTLIPDSGTAQCIGTIGVAEQEMDTSDQRTVGEVIAQAIAEPLAALARLEAAGHLLADGTENATAEYATALEHAEALDAWDAERRVQIALEALDAETGTARPRRRAGARHSCPYSCAFSA